MKALDKVKDVSQELHLSGIEFFQKEAELIGIVDLYRDNPLLSRSQTAGIDITVKRRTRREPLQYILGQTDFSGLTIKVGPGVLIPRPETELMVEYAVETLHRVSRGQAGLPRKSSLTEEQTAILDLCTGSGCLALALAKKFPESRVCGTDISDDALHYARENARLNNIHNAEFFKGSLFQPLREDRAFHFIISNPPYIRSDDIKTLQPEIKDWEPLNALDGGPEGLDFYRQVMSQAAHYLKDHGTIMFELGVGCSAPVAEMLDRAGFIDVRIFPDYSGVERIISAVKS